MARNHYLCAGVRLANWFWSIARLKIMSIKNMLLGPYHIKNKQKYDISVRFSCTICCCCKMTTFAHDNITVKIWVNWWHAESTCCVQCVSADFSTMPPPWCWFREDYNQPFRVWAQQHCAAPDLLDTAGNRQLSNNGQIIWRQHLSLSSLIQEWDQLIKIVPLPVNDGIG